MEVKLDNGRWDALYFYLFITKINIFIYFVLLHTTFAYQCVMSVIGYTHDTLHNKAGYSLVSRTLGHQLEHLNSGFTSRSCYQTTVGFLRKIINPVFSGRCTWADPSLIRTRFCRVVHLYVCNDE